MQKVPGTWYLILQGFKNRFMSSTNQSNTAVEKEIDFNDLALLTQLRALKLRLS
jgi:hypothetical protein